MTTSTPRIIRDFPPHPRSRPPSSSWPKPIFDLTVFFSLLYPAERWCVRLNPWPRYPCVWGAGAASSSATICSNRIYTGHAFVFFLVHLKRGCVMRCMVQWIWLAGVGVFAGVSSQTADMFLSASRFFPPYLSRFFVSRRFFLQLIDGCLYLTSAVGLTWKKARAHSAGWFHLSRVVVFFSCSSVPYLLFF